MTQTLTLKFGENCIKYQKMLKIAVLEVSFAIVSRMTNVLLSLSILIDVFQYIKYGTILLQRILYVLNVFNLYNMAPFNIYNIGSWYYG